MTRPYRPSNGTEGEMFMARWCARCVHDGDVESGEGCPIIASAMAVPVTDPDYPPEWVQEDECDPSTTAGAHCTAFHAGEGYVSLEKLREDKRRYDALPRDPVTGRPVIC